MDFSELDETSRAAVRKAQLERKERRRLVKVAAGGASANAKRSSTKSSSSVDENKQEGLSIGETNKEADTKVDQGITPFGTFISKEDYFDACPNSLLRDRLLTPNVRSVKLLMRLLSQGDLQAEQLNSCQYFQFTPAQGANKNEVWDPTLNASLAYEGFFVITANLGRDTEPLPELQPFYSVLTWPNFHTCKLVRKTVKRLRKTYEASSASRDSSASGPSNKSLNEHCASVITPPIITPPIAPARDGDSSKEFKRPRYKLVCSAEPEQAWKRLDSYHCGNNWLTKQYFEMMKAGSDDCSLNFKMHCIEMYDESETNYDKPIPIAGDFGFTVGKVYTSLSGWVSERSKDSLGTIQMVLLGLWLERKGYAFWSLGHCYSPELDYKRKLGAVIFERKSFLKLLHRHRGELFVTESTASTSASSVKERNKELPSSQFVVLADDQVITAAELLF